MVSGVCPWAGGWAIRGWGSHHSHVSHRDRKKKRFVGQTGQEGKKKVRTESGHYISSSYKNNLYPAALWRGLGARGSGAGRCPWLRGSVPCLGREAGLNP